MTSQDIERRMKRTENDITAVYEMLGDLRSVQDQHSAALIRIEARLVGHDGRFDAIDGRLEVIDSRFDAIDGRLEVIDSRFDAIDARFEHLTTSVSEILRRLPEAG